MPKCLGIYIEDDVIKYAKVDRNKEILKVESSSVVFYEKQNIVQTLEKIIRETFSAKDIISINVSNELYNYFEVFSALKPSDRSKSVDLDFELFCSEKGYNKDSLESRTIFRNSKDDADKLKAIHISTNRENIHRRISDFGNVKITNVMPISTSIYNLLDLGPNDDNVLIVNIEKDTKVTTIIGGSVYQIDILPEGMGEILGNINNVENSLKKSYECCKNTTIYTQDMQDLQMDDNEHLEDIMPVLYKIVDEIKKIIDASNTQFSKVYVTGLGTSINNIDLYFQEYIQNVKVELLKPFFLENVNTKLPIKDYIEVNSAIALALDGLGYGEKELNFRNKVGGGGLDAKSIEKFFKDLVDPKKELTAIDKVMLRATICLFVGVLGYSLLSGSIIKQIDDKKDVIKKQSAALDKQIASVNDKRAQVESGKSVYDSLYNELTAVPEDNSLDYNDTPSTTNEVVIGKNAIPNLLNRIVFIIPKEVRITSIKNTQGTHIVIEAQSTRYDQLGYFSAALSTNGYLENVKSTSGVKSGDIVSITIEGDLP